MPFPPDEDAEVSLASPRRIRQFHALAEPPPGGPGRPNGPLIRLHQTDEYIPPLADEPEDEEFYYDEDDSSSDPKMVKVLSTITEVTERTEDSKQWPLPVAPPRTVSSWSSQTSYGDVIGTPKNHK